jgi:hypothetical protein
MYADRLCPPPQSSRYEPGLFTKEPPVVVSAASRERWLYCYPDDEFVEY